MRKTIFLLMLPVLVIMMAFALPVGAVATPTLPTVATSSSLFTTDTMTTTTTAKTYTIVLGTMRSAHSMIVDSKLVFGPSPPSLTQGVATMATTTTRSDNYSAMSVTQPRLSGITIGSVPSMNVADVSITEVEKKVSQAGSSASELTGIANNKGGSAVEMKTMDVAQIATKKSDAGVETSKMMAGVITQTTHGVAITAEACLS